MAGATSRLLSSFLLSLAIGVDDGMAGGGVGAETKGEDGRSGDRSGDRCRSGRVPRAPRPDLCRRFARKELAQGLPGILERFIDEAQKGSIPHAKALMSMAGLDKEEAGPAAQRKKPKGLSEMLLRELRRRPVSGDAGTKQDRVSGITGSTGEDRHEGSGGGEDRSEG